MALTGIKFNLTVQAMARGGASGTGLLLNADTLRMLLYTAATAPAATDATYATTLAGGAVEVATANGYTRGAGSVSLTGATSNSGGTETLKTTANWSNPTWTSNTGNVALRYFVLYDSTASSAVANLLGNWDYGSTLTLNGVNGDTLDLSPSNFNTTGWGSIV